MTPDRLANIRARAERFAAKMADDRRPALEIPAAMSAADVPDLLAEVERLTALLNTDLWTVAQELNDARADIAQLQAAVEHLTAQLRQAREERAAVALERDEAINDRDLAVAHDRQPYPTADAYEAACRALEKHRVRADRAERVAEAAKAARDLFGPQPYFGGFRELAAAVDEWQRTQEESRG